MDVHSLRVDRLRRPFPRGLGGKVELIDDELFFELKGEPALIPALGVSAEGAGNHPRGVQIGVNELRAAIAAAKHAADAEVAIRVQTREGEGMGTARREGGGGGKHPQGEDGPDGAHGPE